MVVFMMVFIVPRITESFAKAGSALPPLTQKVVDVSNFIVNDYLTLIA
jgi:type II secretory pathway component PulF